MTYLFPPTISSVPIVGQTAAFPVHRIYCVGRNYAAHAREMGKDPNAEPPFFFTKPADAVVPNGSTVAYPPATANFHHEIELVIAIGLEGHNIPRERALEHIFGYAVGIDLTRRDLQLKARDMGRPWDWGKAFDSSAPCTAIHPVAGAKHPAKGRIWLSVNDVIRQESDVADMIWGIADIVSLISMAMVLKPGDLIFTGTPEGVGPLQPGDVVKGGVDGIDEIHIQIGAFAG